jgi:hypothetical protein
MNRGNCVFKKIQTTPQTCSLPPVSINDFFLYAMFARIALSNNKNIEFETKYDKTTNTIELIIPNHALPIFDQLTGMQRGPNMQTFINWLIGSKTLQPAHQQDQNFVPANTLEVWFGATRSTIDETFVLLPPTVDTSVVGHNLKVSDTFIGSIKVHLIWMMICGQNNPTSFFELRSSSNVSSINGTVPTITVNDTQVPTFNLLEGDIREVQILEIDDIKPNDIISLLINRNFTGTTDPQTESFGIIGIRIELISKI